MLGLLTLSIGNLLCAAEPASHNDNHHESGSKTLYYTNDQHVKVTPPAGPQTMSDWNLYVTADFLYWTVREDGMFHAVSGVGANVGKGNVYDLDWKWEPGFKVGLGMNLPHDGWDIFAEYTWINTSVGNTVSRDPATTDLISYWTINGIAPVQLLARSQASLDLKFNDIHLELGRNSYLSQFLKVKIHAGLQGTWINQDYSVCQTLPDETTMYHLTQKQDFWGIGLRAGLDTSWQFTQNWSFFADFALSVLWGEFDLERKDRSVVAGVDTTNIHTGIDARTFEPALAIDAGLRWETWFMDGDMHFLLQAGWDHQLWILQNEFIKVPTEADHTGDLVLQGLTVKARLDF